MAVVTTLCLALRGMSNYPTNYLSMRPRRVRAIVKGQSKLFSGGRCNTSSDSRLSGYIGLTLKLALSRFRPNVNQALPVVCNGKLLTRISPPDSLAICARGYVIW